MILALQDQAIDAPAAAPVAVRTGVDLIEIERIQIAIARHGHRFLRRVYTATELNQCDQRTESLAARFAAKEAVAKALGTGIWRHGITWTDIEVTRNPATGAPVLHLYNAAAGRARALQLTTWSISLSHSRTQAIAFIVALSAASS
jgi:holo-[acyl-carrier protein] synthase